MLFLCYICIHSLFKPILNVMQVSFCILQTSRETHGKKKSNRVWGTSLCIQYILQLQMHRSTVLSYIKRGNLWRSKIIKRHIIIILYYTFWPKSQTRNEVPILLWEKELCRFHKTRFHDHISLKITLIRRCHSSVHN